MVDFQLPAFELHLTEQLAFILGLGAAVGAALVGGAIAVRLRQPAIVGYLLAGVAIGLAAMRQDRAPRRVLDEHPRLALVNLAPTAPSSGPPSAHPSPPTPPDANDLAL